VVRQFSRLKAGTHFSRRASAGLHGLLPPAHVGGVRLLEALRQNLSIGAAVEAALEDSAIPLDELRAKLETWFRTWAELGWFCRPGKK